MNRKADGFPGWLTLWRGWQKLESMVAGVEDRTPATAKKSCRKIRRQPPRFSVAPRNK